VGTTYSGSSVDKVIEAINKASGQKLKEDDLQIEEETDSSQCEGSSCLTVNTDPHFFEFNLKFAYFISVLKSSQSTQK
jgi:indole-3-glycerol phosphate synthase